MKYIGTTMTLNGVPYSITELLLLLLLLLRQPENLWWQLPIANVALQVHIWSAIAETISVAVVSP